MKNAIIRLEEEWGDIFLHEVIVCAHRELCMPVAICEEDSVTKDAN